MLGDAALRSGRGRPSPSQGCAPSLARAQARAEGGRAGPFRLAAAEENRWREETGGLLPPPLLPPLRLRSPEAKPELHPHPRTPGLALPGRSPKNAAPSSVRRGGTPLPEAASSSGQPGEEAHPAALARDALGGKVIFSPLPPPAPFTRSRGRVSPRRAALFLVTLPGGSPQRRKRRTLCRLAPAGSRYGIHRHARMYTCKRRVCMWMGAFARPLPCPQIQAGEVCRGAIGVQCGDGGLSGYFCMGFNPLPAFAAAAIGADLRMDLKRLFILFYPLSPFSRKGGPVDAWHVEAACNPSFLGFSSWFFFFKYCFVLFPIALSDFSLRWWW